LLQHIPVNGESVQVGNFVLRTLQVESHRVQKVQIVPLENEDGLDFEV
jgi:CBS domain containing-hemolysin-like protein